MEILVTLVLIGLAIFLLPYILGGFVVISGVFVAIVGGIILIIKNLFGR